MCDNTTTACIQYTLHRSEVMTHRCTWGHTEEGTAVMGCLCIQARWLVLVLCMALYCHINSPPPPWPHTLNSNPHMPSLCSNPIVPEAATRYTDHYKLRTPPPHPSMYLPAIQLITSYKPHVDSYANSRLTRCDASPIVYHWTHAIRCGTPDHYKLLTSPPHPSMYLPANLSL